MNPTQNQKVQDEDQNAGKKIYRKPSVQIYGTLSEMTQSSHQAGNAGDDTGTPFSPPGNPHSTRT